MYVLIVLRGKVIKPEIKKNAEMFFFLLEPYDAVYS